MERAFLVGQSLPPAHQGLRTARLRDAFRDSPAVDAATYPEIVALARLFAAPYWRHQAIADNLDPEPFDYTLLFAIHDQISAGQRHRDDIPEDIRVAAAGNLRQGPALTRFTSELQRTVNPDYRWNPWSHHRKFPPITQWIMDQIETARNPDSHRPSGWQPPPEHYETPTRIPRPRQEARSRTSASPTASLQERSRGHH